MPVTTIKTKKCPVCGRPARWLRVPPDALQRYDTGMASINEAFPMLSADQREQLLTGLHGQCWELTVDPIDDELKGDDVNSE